MAATEATVVIAGLKGANATAAIPVQTVLSKQLTIKGAASRSLESMERAIDLLRRDQVPYERFASHAFSLEQAADAIRSMTGAERPIHARIEPHA
jgi:threonine dehydrogenase-like Zn-dependent dehydrogenase